MPNTLYYYEHKTIGRWWPRTEHGMPSVRSSESRRRNIRGVIEVDRGHAHYSLNALREIYSIDGTLIYTQGPDHVRKVRGISA